MKKIIWRFVGLIATVIIGIGINYCFLPVWNLRNPGMWIFLSAIILIGSGIQSFIGAMGNEDDKDKHIGKIVAIIGLVACVAVLVVGECTDLVIFNASKYQSMIQIEEGNFEEDINKIEKVENISIVDMETAQRLGDRTVGSIQNSTWYEVEDEYNLIKYQGGQYRISDIL